MAGPRQQRAVIRKPAESFEDALQHMEVADDDRGLETKTLGPQEVLLNVKACCINYPDLLQTTNGYQHKQTFPYTPGLEVSGEVVRVGEGVKVDELKPGSQVMIMCGGQGLATQLIVDAKQCVAMPPNMSFAEAAAFRIGYETAWHCLFERGNIHSDDVVLVTGATGGMGLAAVQVAKKVFGCTVIAAGGSDEKLAEVQRVGGADHIVNYNTDPQFSKTVKSLTGGNGVSLYFDTVGGEIFQQGLRSTAFAARVLIVGFTSGERPKIPANYVLIKCLAVFGCRAGEVLQRLPDAANAIAGPRRTRLNQYAERGWLKPHVSHKFPLTTEGVRGAYKALMDRQVVGRVCVICDETSSASSAKL
ncbi:Quinone oxidoreductase-like protein 2 [Hondaea fermentalgiana]|uniref:Quinone oxidoreductase-like protein 2 n=1 Tax=Hondaea fermentalgiana TaxID=2315210 RepID=A0A2R5GYX3_9STRA|nr:Quinone oxidoreductase-like protein 2 [Hondaea fermentalgiana]|eukprot:GBG33943.1 Quinone oxidoreductase-like protein 2 [Hondaea fermentalgiana]